MRLFARVCDVSKPLYGSVLKRDLESERNESGEISEKIFASEDEQTEEVALFFLLYISLRQRSEGCSFCCIFALVSTNISQIFNRMRCVKAINVRKEKG